TIESALFAGCVLFGFSVGNMTSLPGLIVQQEFPKQHFARAISLVVAINQFSFAFGPSLLGQLQQASGSYAAALCLCLAMQLGAALSLCLISPALADGMTKFEKLIKPQLPEGSLTYKSGKGLGDNGFVLEGVVVTPPPDSPSGKTEPIAIKKISVEDFDFAAVEKQAPPTFAKVRVEGIAVSDKPA